MNSLVIVSVEGGFLSLELSDFPVGGPVEGRIYEFEGRLYQVVEITETLGVRGELGTKITGDQRLLAFADAVCKGDDKMKQAFMKPKKVGQDGPEDVRSAGGIILGTTEEAKPSLSTPFNHIVFVKTAPADSRVDKVRLPRGVRLQEPAAESLLEAGSEDATVGTTVGS